MVYVWGKPWDVIAQVFLKREVKVKKNLKIKEKEICLVEKNGEIVKEYTQGLFSLSSVFKNDARAIILFDTDGKSVKKQVLGLKTNDDKNLGVELDLGFKIYYVEKLFRTLIIKRKILRVDDIFTEIKKKLIENVLKTEIRKHRLSDLFKNKTTLDNIKYSFEEHLKKSLEFFGIELLELSILWMFPPGYKGEEAKPTPTKPKKRRKRRAKKIVEKIIIKEIQKPVIQKIVEKPTLVTIEKKTKPKKAKTKTKKKELKLKAKPAKPSKKSENWKKVETRLIAEVKNMERRIPGYNYSGTNALTIDKNVRKLLKTEATRLKNKLVALATKRSEVNKLIPKIDQFLGKIGKTEYKEIFDSEKTFENAVRADTLLIEKTEDLSEKISEFEIEIKKPVALGLELKIKEMDLIISELNNLFTKRTRGMRKSILGL